MLGRASARVGLVLLAAALAFAGWVTAGSYDAGSVEKTQGAAALVGAAVTALFVGLSVIRDHARIFLLLAAVSAAGGIVAYLALE